MSFERRIEFVPGYDGRPESPQRSPQFEGKPGNFGIHGMDIRFILIGPAAAVQFVVYTTWFPKHVQEEMAERDERSRPFFDAEPYGADLGYHAREPQYDDQPARPDCPYLGGDPCYYDGSGLAAERVRDRFLEGGDDAVWEELEAFYHRRFDIKEASE